MAEPARPVRGGGDTDGDLPPRMPRWVKVSAIVVGVLVLLLLVLQLTGIGGEHGPGRHVSGHGAAPATGDHATVAAGIRG